MLADRVRMGRPIKSFQLIDRTTPTTVVAQPYSTEGNGGRKLVRLDNGWLVAGVKKSVGWTLYISKDYGNTWSVLYNYGVNTTDLSLATTGHMIYVLNYFHNDNVPCVYCVNSNTGIREYLFNFPSELEVENMSLAINKDGTELHACWSSKNSTYPNSFNIRYCKGVINGDGSVTWGNVIQVSKGNVDCVTPTIFTNIYGDPIIIHVSGNTVLMYNYMTNDKWSEWNSGRGFILYSSNRPQFSPSACVDKDGVIHVVWSGEDTDVAYNGRNLRYTQSIDGKGSWKTALRLAKFTEFIDKPSIAVNNKNEIFISNNYITYLQQYKSVDYGETWQSITGVINGFTNPSLLADSTLDFEIPLTVFQSTTGSPNNSVLFMGRWYE